jgi:beta-lactamase class A
MTTYSRYRALPPPAPIKPAKATLPAKFKKVALIGLSLLMITSVVSAGLSRRANQHAAAEAAWRQHQKALFAGEVRRLISANPRVSFSVSATALDADRIEVLGDTRPQDAASTAKVLTAVSYLKQVELGRFSLSDPVDGRTAKQQLQLMLQQSDDGAWQDLNQKIGHTTLQNYASSIGLTDYSAGTNLISSADLTRLLKKLATGSLLTADHTKIVLSYMQHTNYEDFIAPAVPDTYRLYHKVGIDNDQVNDTAIIAGPDGRAFAFSIMTNGHGLYEWQDRASLIQQITAGAIKAYLQ